MLVMRVTTSDTRSRARSGSEGRKEEERVKSAAREEVKVGGRGRRGRRDGDERKGGWRRRDE